MNQNLWIGRNKNNISEKYQKNTMPDGELVYSSISFGCIICFCKWDTWTRVFVADLLAATYRYLRGMLTPYFLITDPLHPPSLTALPSDRLQAMLIEVVFAA